VSASALGFCASCWLSPQVGGAAEVREGGLPQQAVDRALRSGWRVSCSTGQRSRQCRELVRRVPLCRATVVTGG
jgi:hypothetical protein